MSGPPKPEEYLPRILGSGISKSKDVTEVVILGRDQLEALTKILVRFMDYKVELFGLESQSMPETKHFIMTAYLSLKGAKCSLQELLQLINGLFSVDSAKGSKLEGSRYDRFLFPVAAVDGSRLVIATVENLTEIESYFDKLPLKSGNLVMFARGRQSGLALVRSIRRTHPQTHQRQMLAAAEDELRTSGWGIASFDISGMEQGTVGVVVTDPIMTEVVGATQSWLTFGLTAGIIEGIYGMVGHIGERHSYTRKTRQLKFSLVELSEGQTLQEAGV